MTASETTQLLALLQGAYPRQEVTPETVRVYCEFLADLDYGTAKQAVRRVINVSRFWPSIAEIREAYLAESGVYPPEEAWAFVSARNMLRPADGWPSPEIAEAVRVAGGNWAWSHTDNPAAIRNTFLETYIGLRAAKAVASRTMLPSAATARALPAAPSAVSNDYAATALRGVLAIAHGEKRADEVLAELDSIKGRR